MAEPHRYLRPSVYLLWRDDLICGLYSSPANVPEWDCSRYVLLNKLDYFFLLMSLISLCAVWGCFLRMGILPACNHYSLSDPKLWSLPLLCNQTKKMELWLPAMRKPNSWSRCWCKMKQILFRSHKTWEEGRLLSQRPISLPVQAWPSYK